MFFYKVNAFLDRNDLPLNGLATIVQDKANAMQAVHSCWIAGSVFTSAYILQWNAPALKRERLNRYVRAPSVVMNCTKVPTFSQIACKRQVALHPVYLAIPFSLETKKIQKKLDPICKWHHGQVDFVSTYISLTDPKETFCLLVTRSNLTSNI